MKDCGEILSIIVYDRFVTYVIFLLLRLYTNSEEAQSADQGNLHELAMQQLT